MISLFIKRILRIVSALSPSRISAGSAQSKRAKWDGAAQWYRLRYADASEAREMVVRLSRVGGRVALRMRSGDDGSVKLWLAVETYYMSSLIGMAKKFNCKLEKTVEAPPPLDGAFTSSIQFPDDGVATDGYIVKQVLFTLSDTHHDIARIADDANLEGDSEHFDGVFFPTVSHVAEVVSSSLTMQSGVPGMGVATPSEWRMPDAVLGIATESNLDLPAHLIMRRKDTDWLLGRDKNGVSVGARRCGVLGDDKSVENWLYSLVMASLQEGANGLVVIDGEGALVQRLASAPHIQSLIAQGSVTLLDIIRSAQMSFNPLVFPTNGRRDVAQMRWAWWLKGMGIDKEPLVLLPQALEAGVENIPQLYQWLMSKNGNYPEHVASIRTKLERLDKDESLRRWIMGQDKVVDPRTLAKRGVLLVSGRLGEGDLWARGQALRGLLGLVTEIKPKIVLHKVKLGDADRQLLRGNQIIASGVMMKTQVVTKCSPVLAKQIATKLPDGVLPEHVELLPEGTAILQKAGMPAFISWKRVS